MIKTYLAEDINLFNIIAYIGGVHSNGHFEIGRNTLLTILNLLLEIFMPAKCPYSAASSAAIKAGNGSDSDWEREQTIERNNRGFLEMVLKEGIGRKSWEMDLNKGTGWENWKMVPNEGTVRTDWK